ncbi:hypothetical protein [Thalassococcus lentus]|uniref:NADH dehydrogenase n=1 Tax=Thalassococcus lentus TaxID=1210524 RepID=A0ABT4XXB3_9RHOB|nr:hypothetical protein [Thalassococcus lentus]MDA7426599.1 hypothetical protein [Thalassococcus lentus]
MKKMMLAGTALTLLAGCVLPPKDVTPEDLAAFDNAVASIGCTLESERHYLPVELQTGLTREKLIEVAQYKVALEEAVALESGGVKLITGNCAPAAPAAEA